jgi:tetratricopeptide (TPR) repeat protein
MSVALAPPAMPTVEETMMPIRLQALFCATLLLLGAPAFSQPANAKWKELNQQSTALQKEQKLQEVTVVAKQALELASKNGPDHPDVASSEARLGDLYVAQLQDKEAEIHYLRALAIRERMPKDNRSATEAIANIQNRMGLLEVRRGAYAAAEPLYLKSAATLGKLFGEEFISVAVVKGNLADLYVLQKRSREAEAAYLETIRLISKALGEEHSGLNHPLRGLGMLYLQQGRPKDAIPVLKRALAVQELKFGAADAHILADLDNLALALRKSGQDAEALALEQRAAPIRKAAGAQK